MDRCYTSQTPTPNKKAYRGTTPVAPFFWAWCAGNQPSWSVSNPFL
jgi:hypothetical protein